jgi:hypothetical protein
VKLTKGFINAFGLRNSLDYLSYLRAFGRMPIFPQPRFHIAQHAYDIALTDRHVCATFGRI